MISSLAQRRIQSLDDPVTSSRRGAENAALSFFVGGNRGAYEAFLPIFAAFGKWTFSVGESGMGACAKLRNNAMGTIHIDALAHSYGLDRDALVEIVSQRGAGSAVVAGKGPKNLGKDFTPEFGSSLIRKDLMLAASLAEELGHPARTLTTARNLYCEAEKRRSGEGG